MRTQFCIKSQLVYLRRIFLPVCLTLLSSASFAQVRGAVQFLQPPPDPCFSNVIALNPSPWPYEQLTVLGRPVRVFAAGPSDTGKFKHHVPSRPLVLIIDGNGFGLSDYTDLATFLAGKGFSVAVIDRPASNGPDPVDYALGAIDAAVAELNLQHDVPLAVIGHSVGGSIAIDVVAQNYSNANGYDIESLILLAPKLSATDDPSAVLLDGEQIPALMTIYGSQDNDVGGNSNQLTDAFAAYDRMGNEGSTACHGGLCFYTPQMHRTMVYIHGADHSGLVNQPPTCSLSGCVPFNNYLAQSKQFCVAKGYALAMLEWTLDDNASWKNMVMGRYRPPSMTSMVTAFADELGNPAGSPARFSVQVSPKARSVIENFEDSSWDISNSTANVGVQLATEGQYAGDNDNIRHASKLGLVGWPQHNQWQFVAFSVPNNRRDVTTFSHLTMRIGQLSGVSDVDYANPENHSPSVLIGLNDGNATNWEWSHKHGVILPADRRPDGQPQSVMGSLTIPLTAFYGVDKEDIQSVFLAFPAGTQGTLMVDSLQWYRN